VNHRQESSGTMGTKHLMTGTKMALSFRRRLLTMVISAILVQGSSNVVVALSTRSDETGKKEILAATTPVENVNLAGEEQPLLYLRGLEPAHRNIKSKNSKSKKNKNKKNNNNNGNNNKKHDLEKIKEKIKEDAKAAKEKKANVDTTTKSPNKEEEVPLPEITHTKETNQPVETPPVETQPLEPETPADTLTDWPTVSPPSSPTDDGDDKDDDDDDYYNDGDADDADDDDDDDDDTDDKTGDTIADNGDDNDAGDDYEDEDDADESDGSTNAKIGDNDDENDGNDENYVDPSTGAKNDGTDERDDANDDDDDDDDDDDTEEKVSTVRLSSVTSFWSSRSAPRRQS